MQRKPLYSIPKRRAPAMLTQYLRSLLFNSDINNAFSKCRQFTSNVWVETLNIKYACIPDQKLCVRL